MQKTPDFLATVHGTVTEAAGMRVSPGNLENSVFKSCNF
jgi:hypothetical protein